MELEKKVQTTLRDAAVWIPDESTKAILNGFEMKKAVDTAARLSSNEIRTILRKIPSKKVQVLDQAQVIMKQALATRPDVDSIVSSVMTRLKNDAGLTALLPR